jgi:hypothetical protein
MATARPRRCLPSRAQASLRRPANVPLALDQRLCLFFSAPSWLLTKRGKLWEILRMWRLRKPGLPPPPPP